MLKLLLVSSLVLLVHLHDRPDLNQWTMGLQSQRGVPCCDSSEAKPVVDADWRVDAEGHYEVLLEGKWVSVPDGSIVKEPNKYGLSLVWYIKLSNSDEIYIRCFLPAAGA
jgi:hypothetical protein